MNPTDDAILLRIQEEIEKDRETALFMENAAMRNLMQAAAAANVSLILSPDKVRILARILEDAEISRAEHQNPHQPEPKKETA